MERANYDSDIHVIILEGSGRAFCSGYDLKYFAENPISEESLTQKMPWVIRSNIYIHCIRIH